MSLLLAFVLFDSYGNCVFPHWQLQQMVSELRKSWGGRRQEEAALLKSLLKFVFLSRAGAPVETKFTDVLLNENRWSLRGRAEREPHRPAGAPAIYTRVVIFVGRTPVPSHGALRKFLVKRASTHSKRRLKWLVRSFQLTFFTSHFSYEKGFIWGLEKFVWRFFHFSLFPKY